MALSISIASSMLLGSDASRACAYTVSLSVTIPMVSYAISQILEFIAFAMWYDTLLYPMKLASEMCLISLGGDTAADLASSSGEYALGSTSDAEE